MWKELERHIYTRFFPADQIRVVEMLGPKVTSRSLSFGSLNPSTFRSFDELLKAAEVKDENEMRASGKEFLTKGLPDGLKKLVSAKLGRLSYPQMEGLYHECHLSGSTRDISQRTLEKLPDAFVESGEDGGSVPFNVTEFEKAIQKHYEELRNGRHDLGGCLARATKKGLDLWYQDFWDKEGDAYRYPYILLASTAMNIG